MDIRKQIIESILNESKVKFVKAGGDKVPEKIHQDLVGHKVTYYGVKGTVYDNVAVKAVDLKKWKVKIPLMNKDVWVDYDDPDIKWS